MHQLVLIVLLTLFLNACQSNPPAPVVDRLPQSTKPKPTVAKPNVNNQTSNKTVNGKDWRPDIYIVKKGDTLFSIGLEYGFEYKDIAAANNINEPYPIQIGQKLNLAGLKAKSENIEQNQATIATEDGVVVTPINTDASVIETNTSPAISTDNKTTESAVTPILTEPKSLREPYSLEAFNKTTVIKTTETKVPEATKPTDAKPAENKPNPATPANDEAITWTWPTQGKVIANFNEATNKGLDIGGIAGQAINASSSGKVIYSGSDLRGYGKLVIIKHNKTYLSVYAHNSKIIVKEGQVVVAGQKIAEMGDTDTNRVKLHFEIRRLGKSVDPAKYLNQN